MQESSAGWYPDPAGRYQHRYWDGAQWTGHVAANGQVGEDDGTQEPNPAANASSPARQAGAQPGTGAESGRPGFRQPAVNREEIAAILSESSIQPRHGDGTVFGEPVVIIDQTSMDSRSGYRYELFSTTGVQLAECTEKIDSYHIDEVSWSEAVNKNNAETMEFRDHDGRVLASVTHRKLWKSKITVTGGNGSEIGRITQANVLGRVSFELTGQGTKAGKLRSTGTRLKQFDITDHTGNDVGRFVKLGNYSHWHPLHSSKAIGRYVLELSARLPQPLATLVIVAPVAIDLAFNVDQAGYRSASR
ncbi:hypothetical protein GCM10022222_31770 [Amycolatopsis ultiminotia]|uniref:DUF2510 domain-containing protein n=1 Tax=Amycolatopsis ultiminotia TaxID=543629 RepID=A0ABP6W5J7_9PSEU